VLLGGGKTRQLGTELAKLLEDDSQPQPRTWTELDGMKQKNVSLNNSEWWFQSFSLLRNAIAHGDEIEQPGWSFPDTGNRHWAHADDYMRRAITKVVIAAGHDPDLEHDLPHRHLNRAYREAEAKRPQRLGSPSPGGQSVQRTFRPSRPLPHRSPESVVRGPTSAAAGGDDFAFGRAGTSTQTKIGGRTRGQPRRARALERPRNEAGRPVRPPRPDVSLRLALRGLSPTSLHQAHDADRRVVWTRTGLVPV